MSAKQKTSKPTPIGWRIFFGLLALGMTYLVVGSLLAGIVGERAPADDVSLSYSKASTNGNRNDHEWTLSYTFYADGKKYSGTAIWHGNRYAPDSGTGRYHVNYFAPYPHISSFSKYNSLKNAEDFDDIFYGGGTLLLEFILGSGAVLIFLFLAGIPLPFIKSKKKSSCTTKRKPTAHTAATPPPLSTKTSHLTTTANLTSNMSQTPTNTPTMAVGYSNRLYSDEFMHAVAERKQSRRRWAIIAIAAIIVIIPLISYFAEDTPLVQGLFTSLIIAAIVGAIIYVRYLIAGSHKPWEGTVEKKYTVEEMTNKTSDDNERRREERWRVRVRRDDGKKHVIDEERWRNVAYKYFEVGDRVRYLPNMTLSFPYEKFDKTGDDTIICVFCSKKNDIKDTHCKACRLPLLN